MAFPTFSVPRTPVNARATCELQRQRTDMRALILSVPVATHVAKALLALAYTNGVLQATIAVALGRAITVPTTRTVWPP